MFYHPYGLYVLQLQQYFSQFIVFYIKIKLPWEKVNREPSSADYDNLRDQQI